MWTDKLSAYEFQEFKKGHALVCPYCYKELSEEANACCGEAGHGEWMPTCGCCEAVITPDDVAYEPRVGRSYWKCLACVENE